MTLTPNVRFHTGLSLGLPLGLQFVNPFLLKHVLVLFFAQHLTASLLLRTSRGCAPPDRWRDVDNLKGLTEASQHEMPHR